eukprot:SAG11_NODE_9254_length_928_cov_1.086852_1_plen_221_part_01
MFSRSDENHDGKITIDEFGALWEQLGHDPLPLHADVHAGGSAGVAAPAPALPPAPEPTIDRDGVEKEDIHSAPAAVAAPVLSSLEEAFAHYDTNKDGALDESEVTALIADIGYEVDPSYVGGVMGMFGRFDENHDGTISVDEFGALWEQLGQDSLPRHSDVSGVGGAEAAALPPPPAEPEPPAPSLAPAAAPPVPPPLVPEPTIDRDGVEKEDIHSAPAAA